MIDTMTQQTEYGMEQRFFVGYAWKKKTQNPLKQIKKQKKKILNKLFYPTIWN